MTRYLLAVDVETAAPLTDDQRATLKIAIETIIDDNVPCTFCEASIGPPLLFRYLSAT